MKSYIKVILFMKTERQKYLELLFSAILRRDILEDEEDIYTTDRDITIR